MTTEEVIKKLKDIRSDYEDDIKKYRLCKHQLLKFYVEEAYALNMAIKLLSVSKRKQGHWLRYGEDGNPNDVDTVHWQCNQCLETYYGRTSRIPNYCPNCGADMRGEEE